MTLFPAERNAAERIVSRASVAPNSAGASGPAAPTRTDEVGGDDVRWPVVDLGIIILLSSGPRVRGALRPEYYFGARIDERLRVAVLVEHLAAGIDAPQRLRADGVVRFPDVWQWWRVFGPLVRSRQVDRCGPKRLDTSQTVAVMAGLSSVTRSVPAR